MKIYSYLSSCHAHWVSRNPLLAFKQLQKMIDLGQNLMKEGDYQDAKDYVGSAFESAEILFDQEQSSPQLVSKLTSLTIMLSAIYQGIGRPIKACSVLNRIRWKLDEEEARSRTHANKAAFIRHCSNALLEARKDMLGASLLAHGISNGNKSAAMMGMTVH
ncbi:hypothetical protein PN836_006980 [Ningiella sp. W23]|uniref:hypothetical protein n=1 Tax=Ningiella sp. W23 TaxID=3023715 RepID=UPI0037584D91